MIFKRAVVAVALSVAAMGSGCTSPVESSGDDVITTAGKALAFSYDATLDQFTHMSCTNMPVGANAFSTSAYFTYRMGAYSQGGLTLSDAFYSGLKKYKTDSQAEILAASPSNTSTVLQLAMRGNLDYQNLYVRSGAAAANQDYWNMLTDLGSSDTATTLVANPSGSRIRYIRNGNPGGYRMEGSLYFSDNATMVQATRDFLSGAANPSGKITLTFTNGGTAARSPADTVSGSTVNKSRIVFGRGYQPAFGLPDVSSTGSGLYSSYPSNVVRSFQEYALDGTTLSPAPSWSCPISLQLRIVRAADLTKAGANCERKSDPAALSPELKLLRNTLKVEDWYIDLTHHCMIPKRSGTDCYGSRTDIAYTMGDTCSTDATGFSNCVQYASTCYRTN